MTKKDIGNLGESIAQKYYLEHGYNIVALNWRFKKIGEIDIIVSKDDLIVFSEVKYRSESCFSKACEAVGTKKQRTIRYLAEAFLYSNRHWNEFNIRFDVVEVYPLKEKEGILKGDMIIYGKNVLNVIKNAF